MGALTGFGEIGPRRMPAPAEAGRVALERHAELMLDAARCAVRLAGSVGLSEPARAALVQGLLGCLGQLDRRKVGQSDARSENSDGSVGLSDGPFVRLKSHLLEACDPHGHWRMGCENVGQPPFLVGEPAAQRVRDA